MKIHHWLIHAGAALALFLVTGAEAQDQKHAASNGSSQEKQPAEASTLVLPTRVRLTMTNGRRREVELLQLEPGRAIVRASDLEPTKSIALTEVTSAEISHGRHGHALKGFLWGGSIGFLLGFATGGYCEGGCSFSVGERLGAGAVVGLLFGGLGAFTGAVIQTERWSDIPVSSLTAASPPVKRGNELAETSPDRRVRFAIGPAMDRGIQARFSINWR